MPRRNGTQLIGVEPRPSAVFHFSLEAHGLSLVKYSRRPTYIPSFATLTTFKVARVERDRTDRLRSLRATAFRLV